MEPGVPTPVERPEASLAASMGRAASRALRQERQQDARGLRPNQPGCSDRVARSDAARAGSRGTIWFQSVRLWHRGVARKRLEAA